MHCPHTLDSALLLIYFYDIKKFREFSPNKSWKRLDSNPGKLGEKRKRYLCAMLTPYISATLC